MRTVRLNGELGKRFGRVHKLDVRTPAEAIRALVANFPEMHAELVGSSARGVGYRCVVDKEIADEDRIGMPMSKSFTITPVVSGGGKTIGIVLGVALIVAAFAFAPATLVGTGMGAFTASGMTAGIGFLGMSFASVAWLGAALVIGGIYQMLAPTPKGPQSAERNENKYFNGAINTIAQGGAVPIGYGRAIVGSVVISASVTVEQNTNRNPLGVDFVFNYTGRVL